MFMKKINFFLAAALMMVGTSANAQFVQGSNSSSSNRYNAGWNEFTFDLGYGKLYADEGDGDADLGTVAFNYARGIHLTRSNGLTLRPGAGLLVGYADIYDGATFVSLTPKVDFGYHFTFPSSSVSLFPYVGITTRINLWGQIQDDYDDETYDMFDEDEGGGKRFQAGLRIGFDAHFNRFVLGMTYENDLTEFGDNVKLWQLNLKLGWCF